MQKFRDILSRWERGDLSMMEAGELLGVSERQFRRIGTGTRKTALRGWRTDGWASRRPNAFRQRMPS
jgi:hypothetical protein